MYPQNQADQMMSPMQLEMLARREQMDGMPEVSSARRRLLCRIEADAIAEYGAHYVACPQP
jgi:hypothetical protein